MKINKGIRFTLHLAVYVLIFFSIAIAVSFFTDWLRTTNFFGDTRLQNPIDGGIDKWYEWGTRHFLYAWMLFLLGVVSVIRLFIWAFAFWNDEINAG